MKNNLSQIPRALNIENIDKAIADYNILIKEVPLFIKAENVLTLIKELKRGKLEKGPYPGISIFEAANRIMTDLTILYGVRDLLTRKILEIHFDCFHVELGNENKNPHDIMAESSEHILIGEAFNVAPSFFYTKKSSALKKLKNSVQKNTCKLLLFNEDAVHANYTSFKSQNEYHHAVKILEN